MAQTRLATFPALSTPLAHVSFHADGAWTVHCGDFDGFDDDAAVVGWMEA